MAEADSCRWRQMRSLALKRLGKRLFPKLVLLADGSPDECMARGVMK